MDRRLFSVGLLFIIHELFVFVNRFLKSYKKDAKKPTNRLVNHFYHKKPSRLAVFGAFTALVNYIYSQTSRIIHFFIYRFAHKKDCLICTKNFCYFLRYFFRDFFAFFPKRRKKASFSGILRLPKKEAYIHFYITLKQKVHQKHQRNAHKKRERSAAFRAVRMRFGDHFIAYYVEHRTACKA